MELIGNYDAARDTMSQNENSQLVSDTKQIHIKLPPKFLGNIGNGVKDYLTSLISKQERMDDAYPIAYTNIKIRQALGKIISDQPCIHFDICADFILFKPEVGCKLEGKVNKLSKRHMGCLVHGCFNAWVPHTPVTETAPSNKVLATDIQFTVVSITTNRNILSIKGKFEKFLSEHLETFNKTGLNDGKGKKNKSNSMIDSESHENVEENKDNDDIDDSVVSQNQTNNSVIDEDTSTLTKKKKKRKKDKKKADEQDNDDVNDSIISLGEPIFSSTQVDLNSTSEAKKPKKKKKHDKSLNDSVCDAMNDSNVSGTVNGDMNLNNSSCDNQEASINKQSDSKSRKRKHSESKLTKIKDHVSDNSSLSAATPAKKHKKHKKHSIETQELESVNNSMDDFVVGSSSSKKSKKKKKKIRV